MQALKFKQTNTALTSEAAIDAALSMGGVTQIDDNPLVDKILFPDGSTAIVQKTTPVGVKVFDPDGIAVHVVELYADEAGRLVETLWTSTDGTVEFSAQGGGLMHKLPRAEFERKFKPAELPAFKLQAVSAEWFPEGMTVPAYTTGQRWNGWAMPYFTFEAAKSLFAHMPELRYDSERDMFCSKDHNEDDADYDFPAETITVDGKPVKVYAIGAGCWCWDLET